METSPPLFEELQGPGQQFLKNGGVQTVNQVLPLPFDVNQIGASEQVEVPGHAGGRDGEASGDVTGREGAVLPQEIQDFPAGGIGNGPKSFLNATPLPPRDN